METVSIDVQNHCAACGCACTSCLLCSLKRQTGVDYFRGRRLAERFADWKQRAGSPLPLSYTVGYCAEYPELADNLAFNRALGMPGANFLQVNGVRIRSEAETRQWLGHLRRLGIDKIDTSFFGDRAYHDRFAGRSGDYGFMLAAAKYAADAGLVCAPSIPVTAENADMVAPLLRTLAAFVEPANIHAFLPDYRGRGHLLEAARLTQEDCGRLPAEVRAVLSLRRHKTEAEWLAEDSLPEYTKRALRICLTEENIGLLEGMTCEEIIAYAEGLDDAYYAAIPSIHELAQLYGDPANTRLYRPRDLFWKWQRRYIAEYGLHIHDVTDERLCGTLRS